MAQPSQSARPILSGFSRPIAGEQMTYHCFHPYATRALITRCIDGRKTISWQTEPVPVDQKEGFVTFGWIAGHSAGTSTGDRLFRFAVNGEEWFSVPTHKNTIRKEWVLQGKNGATLSFDVKWEDSVHDLFGYLFLKVPVSHVPHGRPLELSMTGESANAPDWFMTFTYEMRDSVSVLAQPALVRAEAGARQLIEVLIDRGGPGGLVELITPGEPRVKSNLQMGFNRIPFTVPQVTTTKEIVLDVLIDGVPAAEKKLLLRPVAYREFWLLPHSHNDIGYSDLQADVLVKQLKNLRDAMNLARKTAGYPEEARFKWNTEILWAVDHFLATCTAAEREEFIQTVRQGGIGLDGLYSNQLTGLCRPEELLHLTDFASRLRETYGVKINDAMITDIPGYTWATVPALAQGGIKYFSSGPNYVPTMPDQGDRVGHFNRAWADRPFYWVSQSGQERVLLWVAGKGYSWFHDWIAGKAGPRTAGNLFDYARELDQKEYPYEMVQLRYTIVADNGPVDPDLPDFVKEWNERYVTPRLVIATTSSMFEEFERRWGDRLPSFAGDISPFWEDGALSTLRELGMVRLASERLVQAEAVSCITGQKKDGGDALSAAWRNVHLFDEHTWGAHNSISEPESPFAVSQWRVKREYAVNAEKQSMEILTGALQSVDGESAIDVINSLSWPRTDLVLLAPEQSKEGNCVTDVGGKIVPSQRLSTGELAFVAVNVPPLGGSRYFVSRKAGLKTGGVVVDHAGLRNTLMSISLDPKTGAIQSLKMTDGTEFVDSSSGAGLNQYLYVPGKDPARAEVSAAVKIEVLDAGPLVGTLRITSTAPGCNALTQEVRIVDGLSRVELMNVIDKKKVLDKESIHFAFPVHVPEGVIRLDGGWGIVRPTADQLPGSCLDYLPAGRWVDVSNQACGITWTTIESPLVEIGAMTNESPNSSGARVWRTSTFPGTRFFSYAMNNYWHTNYKADQEGPATLHYAIFPHAMFVAGESYRRGVEQSQKLLVRIATAKTAVPGSLFTINNSGIVVTSLAPCNNGKGLLIRLFNAGGRPEKFGVEWGSRKPATVFITSISGIGDTPAGDVLSLPAFGIMTIRSEWKE